MDQKLMYAFRGWIGFVAFMDIGTAIRCFIEKRSFLGDHTYSNAVTFQYNEEDDPTLPRILGYYSILKAMALTHCTLYIHYRPVVSLGICSLVLAIFMYFSEALYFHSTTLNFYIVFPCVLNALTLIGLVCLPKRIWEPQVVCEDENVELLRQANQIRRKRHKKDT
ncbi:UNVERIFIED_CONTAM: hypothetical protein PYX00_003871 [Menopon gallinae]|uniref:Uncharacterized protein n=1 Tax=Menopon gallinae TaxID=328185 RepID=A0AAW2I1P9_9NEOP